MRSFKINRSMSLRVPALASCLALLAFAAPALSATTPTAKKPRAVTGAIKSFKGLSGTLTATVNPEGLETVYYFEYGPTTAYGSKTLPVSLGKGFTPVKVGQTVYGLFSGYHFRVVAVNNDGQALGKDKSISQVSKRLKFVFAKEKARERLAGFGGSYTIHGTLTGIGSANHPVALQANPYPYRTGFTTIGAVTATNAIGAFTFHVSPLKMNTQFRVVAPGPRPLNSSTLTVFVAVNVTIHARTASHAGVARVYGTVSPAASGQAVVEVLRPPKETSKREATGPRAQAVGASKLRRATSSLSRFSAVVSIPITGYYRVYVRIAKGGPLVSGYSRDILIRTHKAKGKTKKKA